MAVAFDPPKNLINMAKYSSTLISDFPNHTIINDYKCNQLNPPIFDVKEKKTELALTISYLLDSEGKIVWKFRSKVFWNPYLRRPKITEIFQAIHENLNI